MITIRTEQLHDEAAIHAVHSAAFGRENEGILVQCIRKSGYFVPALSLVAEENGAVVGHILFSGVTIERNDVARPVLALAPMAVHPDKQGKGIGSQLVQAGLAACQTLGYPLVVVLGHSNFYPKFGFTPSKEKDIHPPFPVPADVFMVCELEDGAAARFRGTVQYPPAFSAV